MNIRAASLLTACLSLIGCAEPSAEKMLENYVSRVSNALDQPIEFKPNTAARLPAFPLRRERLLEVAPIREGLLDVLEFRQCDLLPLISERNSNLGRVMQPSQQLRYELRFLPALYDCRRQLMADPHENSSTFVNRVNEIIAHKERELPKLIWNSIYTSSEMEQQFSLAKTALPLESQGRISDIETALGAFIRISELTQLSEWPEPRMIQDIEKYYEVLYRNASGGEWLKSIDWLTYTLSQVAEGIEARLDRRAICFNQQPNNQSAIVRNVFLNFYAGELQPYLSQVHQFGERWLSSHELILTNLTLPDSMLEYQQKVLSKTHPDGLWQTYTQARDRHTLAWQRLLNQCGMLPSAPIVLDDSE